MTKDEFLNKIVFGWIKKDLESIYKIRVSNPGEDGNANFPLALCIIVYMDHLGSYLNGAYVNLESNIREYLKCFKNASEYSPELLNDLFRNGLAHDYFARGGISRSNMRPAMVYVSGTGVVLDADSLFNDFIESLHKFREQLTEENFKKRFTEGKSEIEERYNRHQSIINNLPKPTVPIISYPMNSGASGGTAVYSDLTKTED